MKIHVTILSSLKVTMSEFVDQVLKSSHRRIGKTSKRKVWQKCQYIDRIFKHTSLINAFTYESYRQFGGLEREKEIERKRKKHLTHD